MEEHIPFAFYAEQNFPTPSEGDERRFEMHDPGLEHYEQELAQWRVELGPLYIYDFRDSTKFLLPDLIAALGRAPTPAELHRENHRQELHRQADWDDVWNPGGAYTKTEVLPQRKVIKMRREDFPKDPREFETAPARIEHTTRQGVEDVTRLIITTSNQRGGTTEHPVMTTEEINWVKDSARVIAQHAQGGKVFIAGLGLGLLNEELDQRGVKEQVVAELNRNVVSLVEPGLQKKMKGKLEVRQGDFREVLQQAIANGKQFDAISIDAFPNTADEVNRDASSKEVIELALKALKPGGMLTFYPDSRYLPQRILSILYECGIPNTCIHYTVSRFNTSEFTHGYHYGDLMAVPCIIKPVISEKDYDTIERFMKEYEENEQRYFDEYAAEYALPKAA